MNNFNFSLLVLICPICILIDFVHSSSDENIFESENGEGYGTEWIYFPDSDGDLHHINLSMTMQHEAIVSQALSASLTDGVEFRLYNGNGSSYILLDSNGRAVNVTEQDVTTHIMSLHHPLKLITHGWRSSADTEGISIYIKESRKTLYAFEVPGHHNWVGANLTYECQLENAYQITTAYQVVKLEAKNFTVIAIDWSSTASCLLYLWVASETKRVGDQIASFLNGLKTEYSVIGDLVHLIGHSLGAHVVGIAAYQTNSTVHRVTGLDPARPFFEFPSRDDFEKIDSSDAEIVDVIHTCAGLLGFKGAVGTVDFYPNEGSAPQPGCGCISKVLEACSHSISFHYFLKSIKDPTTYPAYECDSWQDFLDHRCNHTGYMGEGVNQDMTGTYYLTTNETDSFDFGVCSIKTTV